MPNLESRHLRLAILQVFLQPLARRFGTVDLLTRLLEVILELLYRWGTVCQIARWERLGHLTEFELSGLVILLLLLYIEAVFGHHRFLF